MENVCQKYVVQISKAKETLATLENDLHEIRLKLKTNPADANHLKSLKRITLEMTITLNEIEHSQTLLDACRTSSLQAEEKYND